MEKNKSFKNLVTTKSNQMIQRILNKIFGNNSNQNTHFPVLNEIPGAQLSVIVPTESWNAYPTDRLLDVGLTAAQKARSVDHTDIVSKMKEYPHWPNMNPGEHYKLLTGLVQVIQPKLIIEIGTATGYSSLAMKKVLAPDAKIVSFDIVPWKQFSNCILQDGDFADGRLVQEIADLTQISVMDKYRSLLEMADFIFIDAAKDGIQEQVFIDNFKTVKFATKPIFMFDDIRLWNMIKIWNQLDKPKLDMTTFGHWAGTGLVDWEG